MKICTAFQPTVTIYSHETHVSPGRALSPSSVDSRETHVSPVLLLLKVREFELTLTLSKLLTTGVATNKKS